MIPRMHLLLALAVAPLLGSCSSGPESYESSCSELAREQSGELSRMLGDAKKASFDRHLVVLETGSEMSDRCRTHYIDATVYSGLPASMKPICEAQKSPSDKYCSIYSVDGRLTKQPVPLP